MSSKDLILESAIELFAIKGKHGARQEEIAERAGVNKAMPYYYFSDKETIFREALYKVQKTIYNEIENRLREILPLTDSPEKKIRMFVTMHYKVFSRNQTYTKLFLQALTNNPEEFKSTFTRVVAENGKPFIDAKPIFEQGWANNCFRSLDFNQTAISIIGMNLIFFLAKPIAEVLLNLHIEDEEEFLNERLESIINLMMYGVMNCK